MCDKFSLFTSFQLIQCWRNVDIIKGFRYGTGHTSELYHHNNYRPSADSQGRP